MGKPLVINDFIWEATEFLWEVKESFSLREINVDAIDVPDLTFVNLLLKWPVPDAVKMPFLGDSKFLP